METGILIALIISTIFFIIKTIKMAQEITDLNAAADAIIAQNVDLKATNATQVATITDLQTQVANSIQPADITPVTQKLNDAVAAP